VQVATARRTSPRIERPDAPPPAPAEILRDLDGDSLANALVAFAFAATGPVTILLSVATRSGLGADEIASWLFGAFFLNGLVSLVFCWLYREPLVFLWTIPGAVLVGPALGHLSLAEVVGAFLATGLLMLALGLAGWVRRAMDAVPMPIVMSMVAGVFLRFGLDLVRAIHDDAALAGPMALAFLALSAWTRVGRIVPPLIGALAVGAALVVVFERLDPAADVSFAIARPILHLPAFSAQAMLELVIPLAITVLVVHNGQGIAVLRTAGHRPPVNAITVACGLGSIATALSGSVSTCLTGPTNAILASSGDPRRHYTAGILVSLLACAFGLFSPIFTGLLLAAPATFVAALAGLAMLRILQGAFGAAFSGRFGFGALVTFLVTVSDVTIAHVGAPFWGLVLGFAASAILERSDFGR
jgi:benzoate membrane transport protein